MLQDLSVLPLVAALLLLPARNTQAQQAGLAQVQNRIQQAGSGESAAAPGTKAASDLDAATGGDAVSDLIRQLRGAQFAATQSAALQRVLSDPQTKAAAVPPLIEILSSGDAAGTAAADALAEFGTAAEPAIPALKQVRSTRPSGPLYAAASRALARITAAVERSRYQVRFADDLLSVRADQALL